MNWLKKGRRQFIIFGITILFAAFLIQLNQVEREGLYETEGKTFEKAKVVEIKKDNTTESGNQIGNQLVSLRLLSGKFRGTDRKSTRLNSSHLKLSRMPSSA